MGVRIVEAPKPRPGLPRFLLELTIFLLIVAMVLENCILN